MRGKEVLGEGRQWQPRWAGRTWGQIGRWHEEVQEACALEVRQEEAGRKRMKVAVICGRRMEATVRGTGAMEEDMAMFTGYR